MSNAVVAAVDLNRLPVNGPATGISRRKSLAWVGGAMLAGQAQAASPIAWPTKPIRFVVGWPPGGGTDAVARTVANQLQTILGQSIVIENRGGANGRIGAGVVKQAPSDGYSFLFHAEVDLPPTELRATLGEKYMSYDPLNGLVPVAIVGRGPYILATSPTSRIKDLNGLIAFAKQNPGKLNYGSFGTGTISNLLTELLNLREGIRTVEIPYQGAGPLLTALAAGQVDFTFVTSSSALPLVQTGRLNALAVLSDQRLVGSQIPTMKELGYAGFTGGTVYGVLAPPGLPPAIGEKMGAALLELAKSPELAAAFEKIAIFPVGMPSAEMTKLLAQSLNTRRQLSAKLNIDLQ